MQAYMHAWLERMRVGQLMSSALPKCIRTACSILLASVFIFYCHKTIQADLVHGYACMFIRPAG